MRQRVNHELGILRGLGGAEDFRVVGELAEFAREEGVALRLRAAGCSSILPYLLGLSDVDPLRHRLYFERFRDPGGRWAPPFVLQVDRQHLERIYRLADLGYGRDLIRRTIYFLPTTALETIPLQVIDAIRRDPGLAEPLDTIPPDDEAAFRLIGRGDTEGLCLLAQDRLCDLLSRLQPASIEDLAAAVTLDCLSVEREDLMDQYLGRNDNLRFPESDNPVMLEALGETRGLILYQEQIMMLLHKFGGIPPADGYEFVKAACKRKAAVVAEYRARFLSGATKQGIEPQSADRLFDQLAGAAGNALSKTTCLGTAMTIYQAAYLKAHYRPTFDRVLGKVLARA